ncbi:hypothetical protein GW17_00038976 [Ensete ventricosum]|nr:hypothetical protein GW17_00038976 [Ensete ventricosum]
MGGIYWSVRLPVRGPPATGRFRQKSIVARARSSPVRRPIARARSSPVRGPPERGATEDEAEEEEKWRKSSTRGGRRSSDSSGDAVE